jgi:hypothetical protein
VFLLRGMMGVFEGNWKESAAALERADELFREHCTEVTFERNMVVVHRLFALFYMGQLPEFSRRSAEVVRDARERGDLYAVQLAGVFPIFTCLAADDPTAAQQVMGEYLTYWPRRGPLQDFIGNLWQALIYLYRGEGEKGLEHLQEAEGRVARAGLFTAEHIRFVWAHLLGTCALAAAQKASQPGPLLAVAGRALRKVEREPLRWAEAYASLLRADLACARDDLSTARRLLAEADRCLTAADMHLYAKLPRRCLGGLTGGAEGRAVVAEVDAWLTEQGVKAPERMTAMLLPNAAARAAGTE